MSSRPVMLDPEQQTLIEEAARWRLAGLLFECPTDEWRESLAALAAETTDPDLKEAAAAAQSEASEGLYHSIFGPGGPASPREAGYHNNLDLGGLMAELADYYEAFGYQPATQEPCDHVAVEAGFFGYLRLKEAYARACLDGGRAKVAADAARRFLKNHLLILAERLATGLQDSGVVYLSTAARALKRIVYEGL